LVGVRQRPLTGRYLRGEGGKQEHGGAREGDGARQSGKLNKKGEKGKIGAKTGPRTGLEKRAPIYTHMKKRKGGRERDKGCTRREV